MKIILGADHAGFIYKSIISLLLNEQGYNVVDVGTDGSDMNDDYPDFAEKVVMELLNGNGDRGILICGSAVGVSIAANKFAGIRAGVCNDTYTAHQCVEHDNVNILCLGERVTGIEVVKEIVLSFLKAEFSHVARHERRLDKIKLIEKNNMKEHCT